MDNKSSRKPKKSLSDRVTHAYMMSNRYLGDANEAIEAGKPEKAEKLEAKAQYWLDQLNKLENM
jgi:hypothetical protein